MIPSSLIPDLRALRPDQSPEENLLNARLVCRLLADRVLEFQFVNARDFAEFLRQVANAARKAGGSLSEMKSPKNLKFPVSKNTKIVVLSAKPRK